MIASRDKVGSSLAISSWSPGVRTATVPLGSASRARLFSNALVVTPVMPSDASHLAAAVAAHALPIAPPAPDRETGQPLGKARDHGIRELTTTRRCPGARRLLPTKEPIPVLGGLEACLSRSPPSFEGAAVLEERLDIGPWRGGEADQTLVVMDVYGATLEVVVQVRPAHARHFNEIGILVPLLRAR